MSSKKRFQELFLKIKEWAKDHPNEELDQHLKELETEINSIVEPQSDDEEGDPGGNSPSHKPQIP
jgi:predicted methyltransferase